jgi:DNA-directed RNA polymerase specialized sigma24 family protein
MDSILSALPAAQADRASKPSPLEEVVNLFDQFRDRPLRYALSFGLPAPDGEEIVQEVFLALFRHLQQGKPRQNLPGWLFRVTHNLAVKQREQSQRNRRTDRRPVCVLDCSIWLRIAGRAVRGITPSWTI